MAVFDGEKCLEGQRTVRRKKICPPHKRVPHKLTNKPSSAPTEATISQHILSSTHTCNTSTFHSQSPLQTWPSTSTQTVSASRKKLSTCKSPHTPLSTVSSDSDDDMIERNKLIILELDRVNEAIKSSVASKECSGSRVVFVEDHASNQGLFIKSSVVSQYPSPSRLRYLCTKL